MKCHKAQKLLVPFLDRDLSGRRKEKVEAHLKTCAHCQREKELLSKSWQMLDNYAVPKLKEDFVPSLMEKIRSEQAKTVKVSFERPGFSSWFSPRRLVPVLATLLIAVLAIFSFWKKPVEIERVAKITPPASEVVVATISDEDIIQDLDLYKDIELLENFELLSELEIIEDFEKPSS